MDWSHLIESARMLSTGAAAAPGRPRQAMLKRAVSTAYYAMFHALCASNADTLIGTSPAVDRLAWTRTYRALDHGFAKQQMTRSSANLPAGIQTFAASFTALQEQRHQADYNPDTDFRRSDVIRLISRAENDIQAFYAIGVAERRTFATLVLLRDR